MAEGHAVARWADALRPLVGDTIHAVATPPRWRERAERLIGTQLTGLHTHGKHLVLEFSNGWVIHTHAMQYGSWQIGSRRQALRKDARFVRLRLETPRRRAVFFHGPVMEVLSAEEFAAHDRFHALGPDVLHDGFDVSGAHAAVTSQGEREIGDVVLDQRVVSGIGNIYKSECLFLAAIHPQRAASSIGADELTTFFAELIPLMQAGRRQPGMIETLPHELRYEPWMRTWVYRRRGQPCFVCATPILMVRQGDFQRTTYFCPFCQPATAPASTAP
ncbi:MAG TPA: DNA-formamidopyrimidine glycosylase family protein [Gemmatimonadaceae bacterium]|nr:DNA-formamidopyrimidine glycosylase family protein [Gemmatimonadaceae bacterium]